MVIGQRPALLLARIPAGLEPAQSPLGTGIGESMSPLRLPIRTLYLPSSQSETTFQLQRMSPPGCDTRGVVTRIRAVLWLALLRLPAASRCRDSYAIV